MHFIVLSLVSLSAQGVAPAQAVHTASALGIVRAATAAVEGDSVPAVRARWEAAAAGPGRDPLAILGLAAIARLTYDYDRADSLNAVLFPGPPGQDVAVTTRAGVEVALTARANGRYPASEAVLDRVIQLSEGVGDRFTATEARIILATLRARTAGPDAAEALFRVASTGLADPYLAAMYHCGRADMLVLSSRPAAEVAEVGAALAREAGLERLYASCLGSLASDLARMGDSDRAAREMGRVAVIRRGLKDFGGVANALQWRGFVLRSMGLLNQARLDLEEALEMSRISKNSPARAWSFLNLAFISLSLGDAVSGALHADSAATLFAAQGDLYGQGTSLGVQGDLAQTTGDLEAAEAAYQSTLEVLEPLGFATGVVTARISLAHVAMARGRLDDAGAHLAAAERSARAAGMEGRLQGLSYHRGVLAVRQGLLDRAEAEFRPALARVETRWRVDPGGGQPDWAYYYRLRLAEVLVLKGEYSAAEGLAFEAMDALEAWRATLSEREMRQLAFQVSEDRGDPDLGFATIVARLAAVGRVSSAFDLAERVRARALSDQATRIGALQVGTDNAFQGGAEGAPGSGPSSPQQPGPNNEPRSAANATGAARLVDVQAAMAGRHVALLHFVTGRGGEPTTLFVIDEGSIRALHLPPADSLAAPVRRLHAAIASGASPDRLAHEVSEAVFGGALDALPLSIEGLVIVPDGPLHMVPFPALPLDGLSLVLDRFTTTVQPSATQAVENWRTPWTARRAAVLALGDPDLTNVVGAKPYARLPGAGREARQAARYGSNSLSLTGSDASEANLRALAGPLYSILHLATHATVDEGTLAGAELLLSSGGGSDGRVGPGELAALSAGADLVLLSSCSSAAGRVIRGEGLVGLASALREAGARTVIVTRWPTDDALMSDLIERVYRGLAAGATVAEATRDAQRSLRDEGLPPSVWASLVVVGDPDLTFLLSAPGPFPIPTIWMIGLGGLFAILFITSRMRGRSMSPQRWGT